MSAVANDFVNTDLASPDAVLAEVTAFHRTAAIRAAIELRIFTAIGTGASSAAAIAAATGVAERGARILCNFLVIQGLLTKSPAGYALTATAQVFLDRQSPAYMGDIIDFFLEPNYAGLYFSDPAGYVRNGGAQGLAAMSPDNPVWIQFARAMTQNPLIAGSADALGAEVGSWPEPPGKVLDIAAGHGLFGIRVAQQHPDIEVVAVDWKSVLPLARKNAEAAGISDRYATIAGSAFDVDWGTGYDLVLLPNFLHHFDVETCIGLLRKVRASLSPQGRAIAVEFVASDDGVSAPFGAIFAFMMLASTASGDAYTEAALADMARDAGFSGAWARPLTPSPASLVFFET